MTKQRLVYTIAVTLIGLLGAFLFKLISFETTLCSIGVAYLAALTWLAVNE